MTGTGRRLPWLVALTALLVLPAAPAGAHDHPTPTERAAPAVVYVEARAEVEVSLVEHLQSDPAGVHIKIIQSRSSPVLASASGFVVDPTGAVVTTGALTDVDVDRAVIQAVNEAFQDRYGDQAPMSGDLGEEQRIGDNSDRLQQRLEACYPPHRTNDAGGCVVRVTRTYVVYPHVTSQDEYGQLPAELLSGSTPDVAVLQVRGATSMPTVNLGESTDGAKALAVLGFTGVPDGAEPVPAVNAHLAEVGGTVHKTEGLDEKETAAAVDLAKALPAGLQGGPAVAEQGQVVGFFVPDEDSGPPPAAPGRLVDAGAIREVLAAANVTPRRGPVDSSFEAAMHAYKNGGFAVSMPDLRDTLALFEGHAMAATALADAEKNVKAGTPGPSAPGEEGTTADAGSGGGFPWTVLVAAVAVVLVLAAVVALVVRRRRRPSPPAAARAQASPEPPRPREGQPAGPPRPATGGDVRTPTPSTAAGAATGALTGAVAVRHGAAPGRGGGGSPSSVLPAPGSPPARSGAAQGPGAGPGDGAHQASRVTVAPFPAEAPHRGPGAGPAVGGRPAFCTSCGARPAPHHRFCGTCGGALG